MSTNYLINVLQIENVQMEKQIQNMLHMKLICKKSLKIPKGLSESVNRRRIDNTMVKRKRIKGQTTIYKTLHIKLKIG
jgi:hypothetical protein